jgi:hypothetical protein
MILPKVFKMFHCVLKREIKGQHGIVLILRAEYCCQSYRLG